MFPTLRPTHNSNIYRLVLMYSTDTYTIPVRFFKHITNTLTFCCDPAFGNLISLDQHISDSFGTLPCDTCVHLCLSGEAYPLIDTVAALWFLK